MCEFKEGDILVPIDKTRGFDEIKILKRVNDKFHCRILNGITIISVHIVEMMYKRKGE